MSGFYQSTQRAPIRAELSSISSRDDSVRPGRFDGRFKKRREGAPERGKRAGERDSEAAARGIGADVAQGKEGSEGPAADNDGRHGPITDAEDVRGDEKGRRERRYGQDDGNDVAN